MKELHVLYVAESTRDFKHQDIVSTVAFQIVQTFIFIHIAANN